MIPDIIELHHKLYQNKIEAEQEAAAENRIGMAAERERIRARIASTQKDISTLLREGTSPCKISAILGLHPETVRIYIAKIQSQEQRDQQDRRRFLQTGILPERGGTFAILRS